MLDFNDAKPSGYYSHRQLDDPFYVDKLKSRMNMRAREILGFLWPEGRLEGAEYAVGDVGGSPGNSLKISLREGKIGVGADFAGTETCRDLIDCWSWARFGRSARGTHFREVIEQIEGFLGSPFQSRPAQQQQTRLQGDGRKDPHLGAPSAAYTYTDAAGVVLAMVYRHDLDDGAKTFRPWNPATRRMEMPAEGRPLYNQVGIKDEQWVVFVEGEKAADALIAAGVPATCAMAGCKAPVDKTDWSPLAGKGVVVWPDADDVGLEYARRVAGHLRGVSSDVRVLRLPDGRNGGWDAADAVLEGLDPGHIIREAFVEPVLPAKKPFSIFDWGAETYDDHPEPVEWLVDGEIELGVGGLLVAQGDTGKGMLTMDLALKVTRPKDGGGLLGEAPRAFGGKVLAEGSAVVIAAQDDRKRIHRRINALDPGGDRYRLRHRLLLVPLPNAAGPLPLFKHDRMQGTVVQTAEFHRLFDELRQVPDLKLVVIDPLQTFVHADITADPAAASFVVGSFANMATELNATVLVAHHTRRNRGKETTRTLADARDMIRGTTALENDMRFAYVIWPVEDDEAQKILAKLDEKYSAGRVFKGGIVKGNEKKSNEVTVFVRDMSTGLLCDRTSELSWSSVPVRELLDMLEAKIADAAEKGQPFQHTNSQGLYANRHRLGADLAGLSRSRLEHMAQDLLDAKRVVKAAAPGEKRQAWLDVPQGPFAKGVGEFAEGFRD